MLQGLRGMVRLDQSLRLIFGPGTDLDYLWFINTKSIHHGTESSLKLQTTAVLNARLSRYHRNLSRQLAYGF